MFKENRVFLLQNDRLFFRYTVSFNFAKKLEKDESIRFIEVNRLK